MVAHRNNERLVETTTTKPTLMTKLRGRHANKRTVKTTTEIKSEPARTTRTSRSGWSGNRRSARHNEQVVHHHKRHASIGDKISGAMMKLKGSLTRRPGVKAAGTRRMVCLPLNLVYFERMTNILSSMVLMAVEVTAPTRLSCVARRMRSCTILKQDTR